MGKIGKGHPIRSQTMELINNVEKYFEKENLEDGPSRPYRQVLQRVADATCVGLTMVRTICRKAVDAQNRGLPFPEDTPGKKRPRASLVSHPDNFELSAIRRRIHQFYLEGKIPTLRSLLLVLGEKPDVESEPLFTGSKESLRILITKHLGFKFRKINQRKHLLERTDVVALRHEFLRQIRKVELEKVVFLDETWVNANHSVQKCWQSTDCQGVKVPLGKGKRIILLHAGSSQGFVNDGLLLFESKSGKADYHDDMNAECFTEWFTEKLLPNIASHSIIVMDNAPYHSVQFEKAPTTKNRKQEMQEWLNEKEIPFETTMLKAELYEIIKAHKPKHKKYVIDEIAKQAPFYCQVIRLPPYHCQFNPIERVWADVKQFVAKRNTEYKISSVKQLTTEAIANVSSATWMKHVQHVKQDIEEFWHKDGMIETSIEPLVITFDDDSDSENFGSSSESEGDQEDFDSSFSPLT